MEELVANFTLSEPEEIQAVFKLDLTPSKVSQLENDLGFVTKDEVTLPDISGLVTKEELELKGYLTEHQDISHLVTKTEFENVVEQKIDLSDFENTINDLNLELNEKQPKGDYALKSDVDNILAEIEELLSEV